MKVYEPIDIINVLNGMLEKKDIYDDEEIRRFTYELGFYDCKKDHDMGMTTFDVEFMKDLKKIRKDRE